MLGGVLVPIIRILSRLEKITKSKSKYNKRIRVHQREEAGY